MIKRHWQAPYRLMLTLWQRQRFVRFLLIGAVNTLFSYCLFAFFIFIGMYYVFASLCATVIGVLFNFRTIGKFVFAQQDKKLLWRFVLVYTFTYFINIGLLKLGTLFSSNFYLLGAIVSLLVACVTYLLHKHFVFAKSASAFSLKQQSDLS